MGKLAKSASLRGKITKEAAKQIAKRVRIKVEPNRRPWKNGDPPKKAEVGWGRVKGKGVGVGVRTRKWNVTAYLKNGQKGGKKT